MAYRSVTENSVLLSFVFLFLLTCQEILELSRRQNDEQGTVAPGSIQRRQYIASINMNLTFTDLISGLIFQKKIQILLLWGILLFSYFLRDSILLFRFMLSRSGLSPFTVNTPYSRAMLEEGIVRHCFQGETLIYQESGIAPGTLHVVAVRVLERNRWHPQTGIIEENLIKGLFTKVSMGLLYGNQQGVLQ